MDVRWITANGLEWRSLEELEELLGRDDGFVWLDIAACDSRAAAKLRELGFHPLAVRECQERIPIPKVHVYKDHFFVVLHTIEIGDGGKLVQQQMNCFIHESRYLVTVHGALEPGAAPEQVCDELEVVRHRIEMGRFRPKSPSELAHAAVSTLANSLEAFVATLATQIGELERSVVRGRLREYEKMLDKMFQVRHRLQTVRTIASQSREVHARMVAFSRSLNSESTLWLQDLLDHFDRLKNICDGEKESMQEILDLYQTRVANDLSQLVRRLTAIGAILVADTLVAGIYGMNFDTMPELHWKYGYPMALGMMVLVSAGMAWWFHKKDWL
jgi:magnesium transporter